ncbi:sodium ion-translocating decarboxylase subunit beta [Blautia schinkii]|nr:sodium ion-translocating decarboxylase subunit beta [Blautia schinkii]
MIQKDDKKEKYIRQVCRNLQLSHEMKKRVESDLRTDIELRLESGKNMADIIRELGTPREAAAYFNVEMTAERKTKFSGLSWFFLAAAVVTRVSFICYYIFLNQVNDRLNEGISIIGGADGPTSIFIAGKISGPAVDWLWGAAIVCGFLAAFFLCAGYGKSEKNHRIALILSVIGILFFVAGIVFHLPITYVNGSAEVHLNIKSLFSRKNILLMVFSLIPVITLAIAIYKRKKTKK